MLAFSPSLTCGLRVVPRAIDPAIRHGDGSKVNTVLELSQSESENTLERRLVPEGQPELSESEIDYTVNISPPRARDDNPQYAPDPAADWKRHAPYVTFGDGTISATSGVFGSVLRISQYVNRDGLVSRMVTLDYHEAPRPYCIVARADDLVNHAQSRENGFGIRPHASEDSGTEGLTAPSLTFLGDRWPRIRYTVNDVLDFRVDLVCRDHMVMQRMRITNQSPFTQKLRLNFDPSFLLRDLDYTMSKDEISVKCRRGPYGRSLVVMEQGPSNVRDELLDVVIGLFKDGVAQELNDASILPVEHELNYRASVEFVCAFKIQTRDPHFGWKDFVIPNAEVNRCFDQLPAESIHWEWPRAADMHMRWSLRRNLEHILGTCSVHVSAEKPAHDSVHATTRAPSSIVVDGTLPQKSVSVEHNEGPQIILETPEGDSYFV